MKLKDDRVDILDFTEPITKIYFVRHGQTLANKQGLIFGQWDLDLNDTGIKQATLAGQKLLQVLKKEKISTIITSPLKRTRHTAKIISKITKIKNIVIDKNLIEKSEGDWEKKSYWMVRQLDPKGFSKWLKDPYRLAPPNGESVLDLEKRVNSFYKSILKKYKGKNIIVVSHSGPIRQFILNILGTKIEKYWCLKVENGSISEVRISKNHSIVWAINRV